MSIGISVTLAGMHSITDQHGGGGHHFLALPAEVRVSIYEAIVNVIRETKLLILRPASNGDSCLVPDLITTCKQIHHEFSPIYYANATLEVKLRSAEEIRRFREWLISQDRQCIRYFRRFEIICPRIGYDIEIYKVKADRVKKPCVCYNIAQVYHAAFDINAIYS